MMEDTARPVRRRRRRRHSPAIAIIIVMVLAIIVTAGVCVYKYMHRDDWRIVEGTDKRIALNGMQICVPEDSEYTISRLENARFTILKRSGGVYIATVTQDIRELYNSLEAEFNGATDTEVPEQPDEQEEEYPEMPSKKTLIDKAERLTDKYIFYSVENENIIEYVYVIQMANSNYGVTFSVNDDAQAATDIFNALTLTVL